MLALVALWVLFAGEGFTVGEAAPPLHVKEWVHGTPVELPPTDGRFVLLDFWGSWCPPCLGQLTRRAAQVQELTAGQVRGVAITEERPAEVREYLEGVELPADYVVGCDDDRRTRQAYLRWHERTTLPFTVLIDPAGELRWWGDPREHLEAMLRSLAESGFDPSSVSPPPPLPELPTTWAPPGEEDPGSDATPDTVLTGEQASADLEALHQLMVDNYAGYDDLDWQLRRAGSSWEQRLETQAAALHQRSSWTSRELYAELRNFLDPVEDVHFWIRGAKDPATDRHDPPLQVLYTEHSPYYTDLRVLWEDGEVIVIEVPDGQEELLDSLLLDVPEVVAGALERDTAVLLPAIPTDPGTLEFHVACFRSTAPTEGLTLSFEQLDGTEVTREFPLHRGGVYRERRGANWELLRRPTVPYTTLAVRTCNTSVLDGMAATARHLRHEDVLVLDLRRNGGGSDTPAVAWNLGLSGNSFRWHHAANRNRGVDTGPGRWGCYLGGTIEGQWQGLERAPKPYPGRLFILIDRGVASSGESFLNISAQVPGAVILGENTAGCTSYGNATVVQTLPASGITVRFGHTKFVHDVHRPIPEGQGAVPDYWLDREDPYEAIRRLLEAGGSRRAQNQ